jgi:hypothetical protein
VVWWYNEGAVVFRPYLSDNLSQKGIRGDLHNDSADIRVGCELAHLDLALYASDVWRRLDTPVCMASRKTAQYMSNTSLEPVRPGRHVFLM